MAATLIAAPWLGYSQLLQRWDLLIYDQFVTLWERPADPAIELVVVDERSLQALGRWPWPRRLHARMLDRLSAAGARAIGMDVLFSEADSTDPEGDRLLANAIERSGRVVLPLYPQQDPQGNGLLEVGPIEQFRAVAAALGHVDAELDTDGIARSIFLRAGLGVPKWPALALAMLLQQNPQAEANLPGARRPSQESKPLQQQWVRDYQVLIPFSGSAEHYSRYSYIDLLEADPAKLDLAGKWLLIGVDAAGLGDTIPTPTTRYHRPMSGVEFNANVLDALLNGIAPRPLSAPVTLAITMAISLSALLCYPLLSMRGSLLLWLLLVAGSMQICGWLLLSQQLWFAPASLLLLLGVGYPGWLWGRIKVVEHRSDDRQERSEAALATLQQGMIIVDPEQRIEFIDPIAEQLTNTRLAQFRSLPLHKLLAPISAATPLIASREDVGQSPPQQARLVTRHGAQHYLPCISRPIHDRLGKLRGWIITLGENLLSKDVDEGGIQDQLTGLPSRSLLVAQLTQIFHRADRTHHQVALLFVNLSGFRKVNQQLGYHIGDLLLQRVAERARGAIRESDLLARNGGDEFVVVLEDLDDGQSAVAIVRKLLEQIAIPYRIKGHTIEINATAGISLYPKDGREPETLLRSAYSALRKRKGEDNQDFNFFSEQLREQLERQQDIEQRLQHAIDRQELSLYYQPQLDIKSGRIVGAEVLLRWSDQAGNDISPEQFIPVAETSGLIHTLGLWVYENACRQLRRWLDQGVEIRYLAVNLSPVQLQSNLLLPKFRQSLERHRLNAGQIELEITEGAIMRDLERATDLLAQYSDLGGHVVVDDFGTGYSSFSYLRQLPVSRLKIDKSFINGITLFQDDAIITLSIISMAHGLSLQVVAEGVETDDQLALLQQQECDVVQGYLLARALPAQHFLTYLSSRDASLEHRSVDGPGLQRNDTDSDHREI